MYITTETLRTMLRIAEEHDASLLAIDPVRNTGLSTFGVRVANGDADPDAGPTMIVRDEHRIDAVPAARMETLNR
jgi:hypothetical protein